MGIDFLEREPELDLETRKGLSNFFMLALRARRPIPQEPEYPSLQAGLYFLRRTTHMPIAEMAFRLGITETFLSNVESGVYPAISIEGMEIVQRMAREYGLPKLEAFMYMLIIANRDKPRRGRKSGPLTLMPDPESHTRRAREP